VWPGAFVWRFDPDRIESSGDVSRHFTKAPRAPFQVGAGKVPAFGQPDCPISSSSQAAVNDCSRQPNLDVRR
jgi:hypothetical protein